MDDQAGDRLARRKTALDLWRAGVSAVESDRLVQQAVQLTPTHLMIAGEQFDRAQLGRVVVVGGGKAGAGMAAGFEAALPSEFLQAHVTGWVNVPADCVPEQSLQRIHLHPARPAGINEPTAAGVAGVQQIRQLVGELSEADVCVVLLSGGGSALLPAPVAGVSLDDKLQITRGLARAGASIHELNTVRQAISEIKGGGLSRSCRAGRLITLIISDVVGDPLEIIASGPTIDIRPDPQAAMKICQTFLGDNIPESIARHLRSSPDESPNQTIVPELTHSILGSNAVALKAIADQAGDLGYNVISLGSEKTGVAAELGRELINQASRISTDQVTSQPVCLLAGGETVVAFGDVQSPGKGGRNQELALAAIQRLSELEGQQKLTTAITLLAAGSDGEDGPTDAAGGFADLLALQEAEKRNLDLADSLARHDAYHFLSACDAIVKTGPTHTNVMDLSIVLVHSKAAAQK